MTSAIIVAAGSSRRMGFDKLLADLAGKPVLAHSIAAFEACDDIAEILIITSEERFPIIRKLEAEHGFRKITHIIPGGAQRHDSVWAGLQKVDPAAELIAVHDGARPLITPTQITRCIRSAQQHRAATSA
ncbi:MAG: 2-C-methyl-D-erythritol 4-phosphate cytidylyltransferase, partial [Pseudoalteromonas tetraodonis]